ncbi:hypothetical protein [Rhizobium sp. NZLR1]|uniref:hypothetical protein n=1 Tax=Rhizobium sp. NZLR1 TaxID=2731096 RepID=UPI001A9998F2|nr:hypothetical protein [Rhizobium sp. NZLR1]MBX5203947.1 hypothetical protein [Rhizobium sp. NZLR1]QSZ23237.1 hypothetical protein J3O30_16030 [Rhizobium sp. NZLR1]
MTDDPEMNQAEGQHYPQQMTDRDMAFRNYLSLNTAILLGILFIAIVFRFHKITLPLVDGFSWREISTAMMGDNFQHRSWNIFFPEVSWTGPGPSYQGREFQIVSYLTALLYQLFGWHDNTSVLWFYGYPFMVLLAVGLWMPPRPAEDPKQRTLSAIPYVWLAAAMILYLAAAGDITSNVWNFHIFHVPVAMFCGHGALLLATLASRTVPTPAVVFRSICIVAVALAWSTLPLVRTMKKPIAMKGKLLGEELARLAQPGDLVVAIAPEVGDPVAVYYSRARGWVFPPGGGDVEWSKFVADDATAIAQLEELRAQGADLFGAAKNAVDKQDRRFVEHHDGVIDYLDKTATKLVDSDDLLVYRITRP